MGCLLLMVKSGWLKLFAEQFIAKYTFIVSKLHYPFISIIDFGGLNFTTKNVEVLQLI